MTDHEQIFLSPPDVGDVERKYLLDAFDSNWIAPLGPYVDAFEQDFVELTGVGHAVALSSGTAGLHLALVNAGIGPDDEVVVPTLTFAATAFAVTYVGARPVFVDSDRATWNLDPLLLAAFLDERAAAGRLPAAVVTVDLYGQCADYDGIVAACERHGVPIIEDAAEGLGATWNGRPAGSFGTCGVFSFNGNKIITTSGGGMLVTDDAALAADVRHRATQAREPVAHYEHEVVGYNYRLSNLLAAVGRGQLAGLAGKIAHRRAVSDRYRAELADLPGWSFNPIDPRGTANYWLTVAQIDAAEAAVDHHTLMLGLNAERIETRPAWKPMHLQPVFAGHECVGGAVAEEIFDRGLCLPSGSSLTESDQGRVIEAIRRLSQG
ncbi:MAG: DegT/DnrJ/EryC1/StrS family aminotransferase [Acidimicrobiales bacterium]